MKHEQSHLNRGLAEMCSGPWNTDAPLPVPQRGQTEAIPGSGGFAVGKIRDAYPAMIRTIPLFRLRVGRGGLLDRRE